MVFAEISSDGWVLIISAAAVALGKIIADYSKDVKGRLPTTRETRKRNKELEESYDSTRPRWATLCGVMIAICYFLSLLVFGMGCHILYDFIVGRERQGWFGTQVKVAMETAFCMTVGGLCMFLQTCVADRYMERRR